MADSHAPWTTAEREEVFAEALHAPETPEEFSAQQAKFRAWRQEERYRHLWPMLDRLLQPPPASEPSGAPSRPSRAAP